MNYQEFQLFCCENRGDSNGFWLLDCHGFLAFRRSGPLGTIWMTSACCPRSVRCPRGVPLVVFQFSLRNWWKFSNGSLALQRGCHVLDSIFMISGGCYPDSSTAFQVGEFVWPIICPLWMALVDKLSLSGSSWAGAWFERIWRNRRVPKINLTLVPI